MGIFVFPILFQPWHMFHDHGHQDAEIHCCEAGHNHEEAAGNAHHEGLSTEGSFIHAAGDEPCPICEYEFSVKFAPADPVMVFSGLTVAAGPSVDIDNARHDDAHPNIIPRAPPVS